MKTYWIVTGDPKLAAVKYFWYGLRYKHRNAKYALGFYAGSCGRLKASKNLDYVQGYKSAVNRMHLLAEEANNLTKQLRQAKAHIVFMQERTELVKRTVAENL